MMDALLNLTAQMAREGIRRLLVLSGDESWTLQQAQALRERLGGDGLWVGPEPVSAPCVAPGALKTLLGREVMHAFFDARRGFDMAAMAALSGTLRAGSWLVLLTPPFADWPMKNSSLFPAISGIFSSFANIGSCAFRALTAASGDAFSGSEDSISSHSAI